MPRLIETLLISLPEGQLSHHGAPYDYVMNRATEPVKYLLAHLKQYLRPEYPFLAVEVKSWPRLEAGQLPSGGNWHVDLRTSKFEPREEHHILWQQGADCFTEFETLTAHDGAVISYGRELHRARPALKTGPRLLLRLSQSYHIRPHPNTFDPQRFVQ